jgi:aspartate aminotransferase
VTRALLGARVRALKPSETLALGARARELRARGEKVVSFAAGEPDFDTPVPIQEAAIEAVRTGHHRYTEVAGTAALRAAVAGTLERDQGLRYDPKQIVVSNGAKHAIWNALFTVLEPGDEVICPAPYWVSFPEMVRLVGGVPVAASPAAGSYKVTPEDLERVATRRTRMLVLNSPNNPSGMVYGPEEVGALVAFAVAHDLLILSDEIYAQLVYGEARHTSPASLGEEAKGRTILINGVSKTWAMTGWRIGYAAAAPELAQGMERLQGQMTSNPASISQQAALAALTGDRAPAESMRRRFAARRDLIVEAVSRLPGVRLRAPDGAFYVFPDCSEAIARARSGVRDSVGLCEFLIDEAKVVCVPGSAFGMEGHIRLSYAIGEAEITEGVDRIREALSRL